MTEALYTVVQKHDIHTGVFSADSHEYCSCTQAGAMDKFLKKNPLLSPNFFVSYEIVNLFEYQPS